MITLLVPDELTQGAFATFNAPTSTAVQFTSNHENYMHRDRDGLLSQLPAFIYNIWVFAAKKMTLADPRAFHHVDIPFDVAYRIGNVKI